MDKKFVIIIIAICFILPIISAADLSFPYNKQYDIKRACFNNGTICNSAATQCNLTYTYPDGSLLFNNQRMTNQSSYFNITVQQSQNNKLGVYNGIMYCCDTGICGRDTFQVEITGDGFSSSSFPLQLLIFIIGLALITVSFVNVRLRMFRVIGGILSMIFGVITLYPGYSGINYSTLSGLTLGVSSVGLGFYYLIGDFFSYDNQVNTYDQYEDGIYDDE